MIPIKATGIHSALYMELQGGYMDIASGDKRNVLQILLILLLLLALTGCDAISNQLSRYPFVDYPFENETKWVCNEVNFVIEYTQGSKPICDEVSYIEIDGVVYDVEVDYHASYFIVVPQKREYISDENTLLKGTWEYEGKQLVFIITNDKIFDGAYEKLYFTKEPIL